MAIVPALVLGLLLGATPVFGAEQTITSAGPLDEIIISDELNCQVAHTADTDYEFYDPSDPVGACGTLIAVGGTLYGPTDLPAGGSAAPRTPFTPVSQSAVTGSGTVADPYRVVTVVDAGTSGLRITETDSYVVGQESYRTDVQLSNTTGGPLDVIVYRAGDCFLQDSDDGFGAVDTATGAVACVAAADPSDPSAGPGDRIEQWFPLTPGSRYYEAYYDDVWAHIGSQTPFPNTCDCDTYVDNGAGLSWSLTIAAGGTATVSHFTTFAPLGQEPLTTTKTADAATSAAGATNGYTLTISNPNAGAITVSSITDTLPAGFTYVSGSSTGVTTADPAVAGQQLTWSGPFSVASAGSISLHFNVTVSATAGTYTNEAGGTAEGTTVTGTGPTAPIVVTAAAPTGTAAPTATASPTPAATPTPQAQLPDTGVSGTGTPSAPVALLTLTVLASVSVLVLANLRAVRTRER